MSQSSSPRGQRQTSATLAPGALASLGPVLDALPDAVIVVDALGSALASNFAARRLLGPHPARLADWGQVHGIDTVEARSAGAGFPLARALAGESVENLSLCMRHAQPGGVLLAAAAQPLRDDAGRVTGATVVLRDITAWRRSEEALRRERDWASAVLETAAGLVVILDRQGRIITFNRACREATGYSLEETQGRAVWDLLIAPEEMDGVQSTFQRLRAGDFPNYHENHWVSKDGSRRLILWSNTALKDARGEVDCVIGTGIDITDRRRIEDELRQVNDALAAVVETSPLAIVRMDLNGIVKSWNPAAVHIFGYTPEEVIGRMFPVVPEDDLAFFRGNLERSRRGETLAGVERQRRRKDGSLIDVALWTALERGAAGEITAVISVIADVTQRKRLEDQFLQSQKMEAVGRLAGGVAHDFNNLLTVMTGYTQLVLDGLPPEDPLRGYVEEVLRATDSAAGLTNQLLAFSRRQVVQPKVLDLNELVAGMDKMLHRLIGEDVDLVTRLAPGLARVKVDPGQFQQVIMNLAVNARDAMPEGGRITIETSAVAINSDYAPMAPGLLRGEYVVLTVSDTGKGMSEAVRSQIFEPFFTTKGKGKGTGLGLSTVYGIVKQAGGEISVWSEPERGATFRVLLPAAEQAAAASVDSGTSPWRRRGTETVLLVEDEAGLRKLIREVLEANGYTVLMAGDFQDALSLCEAHPGSIHLFLTDVVLPGMSGRELATRVTALRPDLRVLYMSGYTDHVVLDHGILEPGIAFLQKPFTPDVLLRKLRDVLDSKAG